MRGGGGSGVQEEMGKLNLGISKGANERVATAERMPVHFNAHLYLELSVIQAPKSRRQNLCLQNFKKCSIQAVS